MNNFLTNLDNDFSDGIQTVAVQRQRLKYNNNIQAFNQSQAIFGECAEISFINQGTSNVLVNGSLILLPTQAISFDGKKDEFDETIYNIVFQGAGTNNCAVIRKFYNT
jgi:hypothetical protein